MNTRTQIILAAKERFSHYGYPKTTMAEVATDCNMSPGNLYRYFKGKLDIATEIAREESIMTVERLRPLLDCPVRSAGERLEEVMFSGLRESFHKLENKPKAVELAQIVSTQRPRFLLESLRRERRVIAIVLDYGRKTGEFVVEDVSRTAATLQAATMKYHYPQLFTHQTLQELEAELSAMLKLFFAGLINSDYEETEEITEKTLSF